MTEQVVCLGCGASLQSEHMDAPGFLPASAREKGQRLCRRCFRIRHYGEFTRVAVTAEDYRKEVSRILDYPGLVLYVLDVFDLAGSLVTGLSRYVLGSPVVVVVNKVDLLPPEVDVTALRTWIRETVEETGVTVADVQFVSAQSGAGVDELIWEVERRGQSPVYVVGMANVGKSTLLNRILQKFGVNDTFTVSRVPGTTLGLTSIDIVQKSGETLTVVDTPGLMHGTRIVDVLCAQCLKVAVPKQRLRPRVFQLNSGQSLWFGGFARFDFVDGERQPVVCYVSNDLPIHRTKLERADYIGEAHAEDILRVPCTECRAKLGELVSYQVVAGRYKHGVKRTADTLMVGRTGADIIIPGLGWLTVFERHLQANVYAPRGIEISVRRRLVGDLSRVNA